MARTREQMAEYQRQRRAKGGEDKELVVPKPPVIKVDSEVPLGRFMLDHLSSDEIDRILNHPAIRTSRHDR